MDNQWNYYRILQVQPDAPFEVIRHNYLLLLKKLRLHPDLGGSEKDTRLVNIAYETLSDPAKRPRYDRELIGNTTAFCSAMTMQQRFGKCRAQNLKPRKSPRRICL